jgi:hypothetical protein
MVPWLQKVPAIVTVGSLVSTKLALKRSNSFYATFIVKKLKIFNS